ncbi:MAG: family 10 glycosylhydrolase, partial [Planctomycetota bacterium]|nr:family 10 glycosylhydrolase [Planctomycetota bacterium]
SYTRYQQAGGQLARDDWRRENVDVFIRRLYEETKAAKPWVQVGLSPFGIWRPGHPPQIQGFDAYAELYADSRKWLHEGWCDYFTPQLYWPVGQTPQDYPTLQGWWIEQNAKGRHIWPGLFTSRVGDPGRNWDADVITQQILSTRSVEGATGNILFSMKAIMERRPGLVETLKELYAEPVLIPASPWLDKTAPEKPQVNWDGESRTLRLTATSDEPVARWVVQMDDGKSWKTKIIPASQGGGEDLLNDGQKLTTRRVRTSAGEIKVPANTMRIRATAVDRFGNESEPTSVTDIK